MKLGIKIACVTRLIRPNVYMPSRVHACLPFTKFETQNL